MSAPASSSGSWRQGGALPSQSQSWGRGRGGGGGGGGGGGRRSSGRQGAGGHHAKRAKSAPLLPNLPGPLQSQDFLATQFADVIASGRVKPAHLENPKSPLVNYVMARTGSAPKYESEEGRIQDTGERVFRCTVVADAEHNIVGVGDHAKRNEAEKLAAYSAILQLQVHNLLGTKPTRANANQAMASAANASSVPATAAAPAGPVATLSDGTIVGLEKAREFMDYYCQRFRFGKPDITFEASQTGRKGSISSWNAVMTVGGRRIGMGSGANKKAAKGQCYVDVVQYLESCDSELWKHFKETHRENAPLGMAPHVEFNVSDELDDEVRDLYRQLRESRLFARRPKTAGLEPAPGMAANAGLSKPERRRMRIDRPTERFFEAKSKRLMDELNAYQTNEAVKKMREQRASLPVTVCASDVLAKIELNEVTICMAATGSGKTTQIPQLIFDDYILRGEGSQCNIICTQPRRIAAISVAERVAKERGEQLGKTVGYQVRFENKSPQPHGNITFCTTGVFLRRLQSALGDLDDENSFLENITHVVVDEVHERDIETDILLVVLKRLLADRKARGKREIKLILMSATIDPLLFQRYFAAPPPSRLLAPVIEVPGRSYPVEKHYLEEMVRDLEAMRLPPAEGGWVWREKNVQEYLDRELGLLNQGLSNGKNAPGRDEMGDMVDDLELPYPLISLLIAFILSRSDSGHVLVFLPGWEEIIAIKNILMDRHQRPLLGMDFADSRRFEVHLLHSSIPVAEQQAVFEPPPEGVRRIILATNIAETSITIPDVVFVVDTGRVKEQRYDPQRRLSSLVSAWVGTSNLNQRAGRAGRHRPGEYYGVLSRARLNMLNVHQTVEMKRTDLSSVCLQLKALDIPGLNEVEDILKEAIEPPAPDRVTAAMEKLRQVGALDSAKSLTSLGRVLLQLPIEAAIGKMCLYGAFFRCLDQTITLAAILTNRDPFMAPIALKREADAIRDSWSPAGFRSDPLGILMAYNKWWEMQGRGEYGAANRFLSENFLSKPTMILIQRVREQLVQSLDKAGVLRIALDANSRGRDGERGSYDPRFGMSLSDPALNSNGESLALLTALIAVASAPNFAIRASEKTYRTSQDKVCLIHPSSVCHRKHEASDQTPQTGERQLFAFAEKVRNTSMATSGSGGGSAATFLRTNTRLDPMAYMLFGAYNVRVTERGMECDGWLPVVGNLDALDDVERLKSVLDACLLRIFEGIGKTPRVGGGRRHDGRPASRVYRPPGARVGENEPMYPDERSDEEGLDDDGDLSLAPQELDEFGRLTSGIVRILDLYVEERQWQASRRSSRAQTPSSWPGSSGPASGRASVSAVASGIAPSMGWSASGPGGAYGGPTGSFHGGGPGGLYAGHLGPPGRAGSGYSSAYSSRPATPPSRVHWDGGR